MHWYQLTHHAQSILSSWDWGRLYRNHMIAYYCNQDRKLQWCTVALLLPAVFSQPILVVYHRLVVFSWTWSNRKQLWSIRCDLQLHWKSKLVSHVLHRGWSLFLFLCITQISTFIILGGRCPVELCSLVGVKAWVFETCEYFILVRVSIKGLTADLLDYFTQQQESQVGVGKLGSNWVLWFGEPYIVQHFALVFGKWPRVIIRLPWIMQQQILDSGIAFLISVIVLEVLAY